MIEKNGRKPTLNVMRSSLLPTGRTRLSPSSIPARKCYRDHHTPEQTPHLALKLQKSTQFRFMEAKKKRRKSDIPTSRNWNADGLRPLGQAGASTHRAGCVYDGLPAPAAPAGAAHHIGPGADGLLQGGHSQSDWFNEGWGVSLKGRDSPCRCRYSSGTPTPWCLARCHFPDTWGRCPRCSRSGLCLHPSLPPQTSAPSETADRSQQAELEAPRNRKVEFYRGVGVVSNLWPLIKKAVEVAEVCKLPKDAPEELLRVDAGRPGPVVLPLARAATAGVEAQVVLLPLHLITQHLFSGKSKCTDSP